MGARGATVLAIVLAGTLAACGTTPAGASAGSSDTPSTTTGTASGAPASGAPASGSPTSAGLGTVLAAIDAAKLPSTPSGVAKVLGKLPGALNGHPVTERTQKRVRYADGTTMEAQPLVEAAGQGSTMAEFWPRLEAGHPGDFAVTSHSKPSEPVLWLTADGQAPYYGAYVAVLAPSTGSWLFGVDAPSEQAANDLLTAFRAALG